MRDDHVRAPQWPAPVPLPGAAYPDWEAIYADNVGRIYRLMYSKVGNRPDAEDLTSQVFLAAYGPLRTTAEVAQVRGYLTATSRTVLAEHWRRTLGHQVTEIDPETTDLADYAGAVGGSGTSERGSSTADERAARILEALPQRQRQILVLRFLRGYSIRQAAVELGVTIANAKVMQHRALRAAAKLEATSLETAGLKAAGLKAAGLKAVELERAGLEASQAKARQAKAKAQQEKEQEREREQQAKAKAQQEGERETKAQAQRERGREQRGEAQARRAQERGQEQQERGQEQARQGQGQGQGQHVQGLRLRGLHPREREYRTDREAGTEEDKEEAQ